MFIIKVCEKLIGIICDIAINNAHRNRIFIEFAREVMMMTPFVWNLEYKELKRGKKDHAKQVKGVFFRNNVVTCF